ASRDRRKRLRALGGLLQHGIERLALPALLLRFGDGFHTRHIISGRTRGRNAARAERAWLEQVAPNAPAGCLTPRLAPRYAGPLSTAGVTWRLLTDRFSRRCSRNSTERRASSTSSRASGKSSRIQNAKSRSPARSRWTTARSRCSRGIASS